MQAVLLDDDGDVQVHILAAICRGCGSALF